jgi:hypothetical protein
MIPVDRITWRTAPKEPHTEINTSPLVDTHTPEGDAKVAEEALLRLKIEKI